MRLIAVLIAVHVSFCIPNDYLLIRLKYVTLRYIEIGKIISALQLITQNMWIAGKTISPSTIYASKFEDFGLCNTQTVPCFAQLLKQCFGRPDSLATRQTKNTII
jgi:hypothetical protein